MTMTVYKMPKMHGSSMQCCMCFMGVFMFLGGVIMLSTGICLLLNYGAFDVSLLPPDLRNDEGKKTVGIILTACGLLAILISVIVGAMHLCYKGKSSINPDELSRIPHSARTGTPDNRHRRSSGGVKPNTNGSKAAVNGAARSNGVHSRPQTKSNVVKSTPGSTEVKHPRSSYNKTGKGRKNRKYPARRLEEIKEQDAISRKTMEGAIHDDYEDTPRSGSFSSEMTNDSRIPKVVFDHHDDRCPSVDSASTSQTSDSSYYRPLESNDKSRRELQFLPDAVRYTENPSQSERLDDGKDYDISKLSQRSSEECSLNSDNSYLKNKDNLSDSLYSAGGIQQNFTTKPEVETSLPEMRSSDESIISYKAHHHTEVRGESSFGRISPQVDSPDIQTQVERVNQAYEEDVV